MTTGSGLPRALSEAANGHAENGHKLTARQAELLVHCVKRGYYDIPRRATLRVLGAELGITATSLSLALRRAEGKIILAYVANGNGVVGDGMTGDGANGSAFPTSG